jgi:hypothetical protein
VVPGHSWVAAGLPELLVDAAMVMDLLGQQHAECMASLISHCEGNLTAVHASPAQLLHHVHQRLFVTADNSVMPGNWTQDCALLAPAEVPPQALQ